jgi:glycosyltransferase involved in cell wall biosynthesis
MALLECMSYGIAPVVTAVGSMGQIIIDHQNGLIVQKDNPESIAQALELLHNDRVLLKTMSINARSYIYDNFKPESYIAKLNSIYHEVSETLK